MCKNIFPESILTEAALGSPAFIRMGNSDSCISPGDPDTGLKLAEEKLLALGFSKNTVDDLLFWCHSCTWWFWWHIMLIILAIIVVVGLVVFVKLFVCDKKKKVQVSESSYDTSD